MTNSDRQDGPVGYKRPPRATQFKPGQSGNPRGRPRGAKNFATAIEQELLSPVAVNEHGRRKKISKLMAIAKQLVNKAASGDSRAISVLLSEARSRESQAEATSPLASLSTPADQQVMDHIIERVRAGQRVPAAQSNDDRPPAPASERKPANKGRP